MTDLRKVFNSDLSLDLAFREQFPNAPKFHEKLVPALSPLAKRLIDKRCIDKKAAVIIDHLAFTFPLTSLRHCHRAGFSGYTPMKQPFFPLPPKIENLEGKTLEQIELHRLHTVSLLTEFYTKTLKIFIEHVLGFYVSVPRDKGFNGYKNSMTMKTETGVDVGFVGIGGQNDTVYIQISGTGCKYLFSNTSRFVLHHWLNTVLCISHLSRIDLAKDDYDDVFNCDYAQAAYKDNLFRTGSGGRMCVEKPCHEYVYSSTGQKIYDVEMVCFGKRSSPVYWRVYNKKLEQKINDDRLSWYRSEVELKKWNVDSILNPEAAFSGVNAFAQSICTVEGIKTKSMTKAKDACLTLASRVRWYRQCAGRALNDVIKLVNGDISKAFGLLLPADCVGEVLGIPPSYEDLLNHVLEC